MLLHLVHFEIWPFNFQCVRSRYYPGESFWIRAVARVGLGTMSPQAKSFALLLNENLSPEAVGKRGPFYSAKHLICLLSKYFALAVALFWSHFIEECGQ